MDDSINAQTSGKHQIVDSLDREFARLHLRSCKIIEATPVAFLYAGAASTPQPLDGAPLSVGESVLRSAAAIEQTFGGITSNLWDDPFEWTLPEYLSTPGRVLEHLKEVDALRRCAFSSFAQDCCLVKRVNTPSHETELLIDLVLETLVRAVFFQSRAAVTLKNLSGIGTPGFII